MPQYTRTGTEVPAIGGGGGGGVRGRRGRVRGAQNINNAKFGSIT